MQVITMPTEQAERAAKAFQKKVTTHGPYTIVPVSQGIVDVFQGSGWSGHSRYRNYKGKWFWIAGQRIDTAGLPTGA